MTQKDLGDQLTLFAVDTLASLSHKPESDLAIKMTDISGRKCLQLSKRSDPLGSVEKMLMDTSLWVSTRCYLTWKPQTTPQGRLLFRLSPQTRHTDATGCGLLHTPTATANQMTPHELKKGSGWWPTPAAADANGNHGGNQGWSLRTETWQKGVSGSLNPQWVEWLMGYPVGYTE